MNITEHTTVADIAAAIPSSVRVFQRHGIDVCCGGKTPLAVACHRLIDHIVGTYHIRIDAPIAVQ